MVMIVMVVRTVIITEAPPPIGISPPGVVISRIVRIGIGVVFGPEVNLFAFDKRVSIVHFTEGFELFSLKLPGNRNLSFLPVNVGVQESINKDQKSPFRGSGLSGFSPEAQRFLKDFDLGLSILLIDHPDNLSSPHDGFPLVGIRVPLPKVFCFHKARGASLCDDWGVGNHSDDDGGDEDGNNNRSPTTRRDIPTRGRSTPRSKDMNRDSILARCRFVCFQEVGTGNTFPREVRTFLPEAPLPP